MPAVISLLTGLLSISGEFVFYEQVHPFCKPLQTILEQIECH